MTPAPNTSIINMNRPLQPIIPINPLNNIQVLNQNTIRYQNSFVEPGEQLNLKEFELLNEIGKGSFGNIYKVKWKVNQKFYALKAEILDDPNEISTRLNRGKAMRNFVQSTGCQGVVNILGSHIIKTGNTIQYFELMELCESDFEKEIKMRSNYGSYYTEGELDNIIKQLISTLSFLQKRHITHRDIKPQNILISNGKYRLCDFGDIRVMQRDGTVVQRIRGSELYMSPILFNALRRGVQKVEHNTYKSDVFSLGMCLFYAACLSFDGPVEVREIYDMNMKAQILNKYLSARYSQKLIKILYLMLLTEESIRPDFIMLEDAILKYGL
jgi:NIMA (never in mitosis gene a)-related kinase